MVAAIMEHIILLLLLIIYCFPTSSPLVYYITPGDHADCTTVNGTALRPCFTLGQLSNDKILESTDESSVELFLLPGTHLILKNQTLTLSSFSSVVIKPLHNEQQEARVVIQCQPKANASFNFHDIQDMKMSSLHFTGCSLQYSLSILCEVTTSKTLFATITACVFENWTTSDHKHYALNIIIVSCITEFAVFNCTFSSNSGAIAANHDGTTTSIYINGTLFRNNEVKDGSGGAIHVSIPYLSLASLDLIVENSQFVNNRASDGGGAMFFEAGASRISTTSFSNNSACADTSTNDHYCQGGALLLNAAYKSLISDCQFTNNSANSGSALYIYGRPNLNIYAELMLYDIIFIFNKAAVNGGAIYCDGEKVLPLSIILDGGYSFSNTAEKGSGGFMYLSTCKLTMRGHNISSNIASNGAGIYARNSEISWTDVTVNNNTAYESGGGVHLTDSTLKVLEGEKSLTFEHNVAHSKGGAIFVYDKTYEENACHVAPCFFGESPGIMLFKNNSAPQGAVLYGGLLDRCEINSTTSGIEHFKKTSRFEPIPLAVTSDPIRMCLCTEDQKVNCSTREMSYSRKRGQSINMFGAVVDQDMNPKGSFIIVRYEKADAKLGEGEGRTESGNNCTYLSYHVTTDDTSATLFLHPEDLCDRSDFSKVTISITLLPCPRGFEMRMGRCECDRRLTDFFNDLACNIDTEAVERRGPIWLRYDKHYLKVHSRCPLDYCNMFHSISIIRPDEQCANHRSGVLCGACQDNYSHALGGTKCLECTSSYAVAWLIPVFAVTGIALVTLLLVCNMTISHGTLNGLIFYSNVISITGLTTLRNCSVNPALSVFIAWVNLDLGVETCFYSGMDTYQKTWLQFAFPLYIWLLVGTIILASHYSSTAMKVFGMNNIAILATLFLLSYTKILKTIIISLNFTEVFRCSANDTSDQLMPYKVWLHDGNIEYLKGKHVPLFAVSVAVLVFLFLPYTLILMFGQCIRSMPAQRRSVLWCIRSTAFISIMDAYHAPYKRKHRYWTGLMLLTRCVLFLAFASSDNRLLMNMYITTSILFGILTLKTFVVYKNFRISILETCFLLNVAILSTTTLLLLKNNSSNSGGTICKCTSASISVSLTMFIGILAYHAYLRINKTRWFTSIKDSLLPKRHTRQYHIPAEENAAPKSCTETNCLRGELQDILTDKDFNTSLPSQ